MGSKELSIQDYESVQGETSTGVVTTMGEFVSGVVNEVGADISFQDGGDGRLLINCTIPHLNSTTPLHRLYAEGYQHPITGEIQIIPAALTIDGTPLISLHDLSRIGLTPQQIDVLKENAASLDYFDRALHDDGRIALFDFLGGGNGVTAAYDRAKPGSIIDLLRQLSQRDAFVLGDTVGNVDGNKIDPTRAISGGHLEYHPVVVARNDGYIQIPFVRFQDADRVYLGTCPSTGSQIEQLLKEGYIPIHPHNHQAVTSRHHVADTISIPAHVLMSKRSMVPLDSDQQVKLSLDLQLGTRSRIYHVDEANNAIENSLALEQLARKGLLPAGIWAIADRYTGQVADDHATTFVIRGGFADFISSTGEPIPPDWIPVTACSMFSTNLLKDNPLLLDFVAAGMDPIQFFHDATRALIETQLMFMDRGWVPELHSQNLIWLIDPKSMRIRGILLRDNEGAKVDPTKMEEYGIAYGGMLNAEVRATSVVYPDNRDSYRESMTRYLHAHILYCNIVPIAMLVHEKFGLPIQEIIRFIRETYINWWVSNEKTFNDYEAVIHPNYIFYNLAVRTLGVKGAPNYRNQPDYPLIPTYADMRNILLH